jgi:D-allose transport system substrate-binding protein
MNTKKRNLLTAGAAALAITLTAWTPAQAADIAIVLKTLSNPYWVAMRDGVLKEAKSKGVTVDVFAGNSEDDIQGQQRILEDALNKSTKPSVWHRSQR